MRPFSITRLFRMERSNNSLSFKENRMILTIERAVQYPRWINIVKKKSIFGDKNSNILERKPRRSDPCEWYS